VNLMNIGSLEEVLEVPFRPHYEVHVRRQSGSARSTEQQDQQRRPRVNAESLPDSPEHSENSDRARSRSFGPPVPKVLDPVDDLARLHLS